MILLKEKLTLRIDTKTLPSNYSKLAFMRCKPGYDRSRVDPAYSYRHFHGKKLRWYEYGSSKQKFKKYHDGGRVKIEDSSLKSLPTSTLVPPKTYHIKRPPERM
jgi:hypothetical protein